MTREIVLSVKFHVIKKGKADFAVCYVCGAEVHELGIHAMWHVETGTGNGMEWKMDELFRAKLESYGTYKVHVVKESSGALSTITVGE